MLGRIALISSCGIAATVAGGVSQAAPARAQEASPLECAPADSVQPLVECAPRDAKPPRARSGPPTLSLPGGARARAQTPQSDAAPVPGYELAPLERDARVRIERKRLSLLERELAVLERLAQRDRMRPEVKLRLGRLYFELAQQRERDARALDQPLYDACRGKRRDVGRCAGLKKRQSALLGARDEARAGNIKALALIVREHPDFARMDEVLFSLGIALEQVGTLDRARDVYRKLLKDHPGSAHVPHAYLAFAEHYFHAGDMGAARQFYRKVVEIPPERNPVHGYALYKDAWCAYNLDDFGGALRRLVETIELARARPEDKPLAPLLVQARRELVIPYSRVGNPDKALAFFRRYADDEGQALEIYERLGELYFDEGQWPHARAVYHGLMAARPDSPALCRWQARVADTVVSSGDKTSQIREATRLVDVYRMLGRDSAGWSECREAAATLPVALAVAWHREAVGTDTQPGTNDVRTMAQAQTLYELALTTFADLDQIAFSDFDARDRPTRYRLAYYRAELAWQLERFDSCGGAFDAVLAIDPRGEFTQDAAYGAVLCYDRVYQERYRDEAAKPLVEAGEAARLAPRELDSVERAMLAAFERYLCYAPAGAETLRIKYRRARVYYEANHFAAAARLFLEVARDAGGDELAPIAANLYLDSLNVVGMRDVRRASACHAALEAALDPLAKLHCGGNDAGTHALCDVVRQLRCDLLRKRAEGLEIAGDHRAAAETYVGIARRHRSCGRLDEVLYNAALQFEAAHLLGRAIRVRKVLIDQYPESRLAARTRFLLGANFHALAFYDQAAAHYEDFAERHPNELGAACAPAEREGGSCPDAVAALSNAIFFRLGLGDAERAVRDAALFEKRFGRRDPRAASRVRFALGSLYERDDDPASVERHYREFLRDYGRRALAHERIEAELAIGRAARAQGRAQEAERAFDAALAAYAGAPAPAPDAQDAEAERNAALARRAAAEAAFHKAELARAAFDAIAFPRVRSGGSDRARRAAAFARWRDSEFKQWIESKSRALGTARELYQAVDGYGAPQWSISAAARVGDMYLAFVDAFRQAPVPPELERDQELLTIYHEAIDAASAPWVTQAKAAYGFCLETATRVRSFNAELTHCESELSALDPRGYPRAAELRLDKALEYSVIASGGPR